MRSSLAQEPARARVSEKRGCFIRFAGDVGAKSPQSLGKARVTAVDVVGPTDRRRAVGDQTRDDERGPGADVAGLHGGPGEPFDPVQHDVVAIDPGLGTQTRKLLDGAETSLE